MEHCCLFAGRGATLNEAIVPTSSEFGRRLSQGELLQLLSFEPPQNMRNKTSLIPYGHWVYAEAQSMMNHCELNSTGFFRADKHWIKLSSQVS